MNMTTVFDSPEKLAAAVGEVLGTSDWVTIDQQRINTFADATDDHQWIHTDPEAAANGPFGGTIAHGFLTLSMLAGLWGQAFRVEGVKMGVNYGLDKVRFPAAVPVDSRIRGVVVLDEVTPIQGGVQATMTTTVEIEGADKPACVARSLGRFYF